MYNKLFIIFIEFIDYGIFHKNIILLNIDQNIFMLFLLFYFFNNCHKYKK